ncbi:MAG: hypothetical protein JSW44_02985 [Candidatus Bathyarchaeota archaeon]|nr:MAG: hypothetical protein JSW44_02985 [Candidatus Bathyarchaeota archaeon]
MNAILAKINWFALAGGATTIMVIVVSLFYPWWQLTVGDNLVKVDASPVNMNFGFLDTSFTIPFIWALNVVSILTLLASGIAMLVYSIIPRKPYSKHLLGFGYKKPLYTLLFFVIGLIAATVICQTVLNFNVPLMGSTTSTLPIPFVSGTTLRVLLSAGFQWSFWLAVVAAGLCIAARLYHKNVAPTPSATTVP